MNREELKDERARLNALTSQFNAAAVNRLQHLSQDELRAMAVALGIKPEGYESRRALAAMILEAL